MASHEERAHSLRSPSKAGIYTACPGAPRLWEKVGEGASSEAARFGTAKHTVAEWCHSSGMAAADFIDSIVTIEGVTYDIDKDFAADVQLTVDWAWEIIGPDDGEMLIEAKVDISDIVGPGESGHTDLAYVSRKRKRLFVLDNKFGRKVVPAIDNPSMLLYAAGIIKCLGLTDEELKEYLVTLSILQPAAGSPKSWTLSGSALLEEFDKLKQKCALTYQDDAPLAVGNHCYFCAAKAICPEMAKEVGSAVFDDPGFDNLEAVPMVDIAPEQAAKILEVLNTIEKWAEDFKEYWAEQWKIGVDIPGWKLAKGRATARQWTDKKEAEEMMTSKFRIPAKDMYLQSLISPTQAEKLLAEKSPRRWSALQELIKQGESKPKFVPESAAVPTVCRRSDDNPFEE